MSPNSLALALAVLLLLPATATAAPRTSSDLPDDLPAGTQQVHVVYALPSDGTDRALDTDGSLERSVLSWNAWLAGQTGGKPMNLDTASGVPDITFVRLARSDAEIAARGVHVRDELERLLGELGFKSPDKLYAVYYDGSQRGTCGGGAWPPTLRGSVAALYLHGVPEAGHPCDRNQFVAPGEPPGYLEFAMLHEILHTLGHVPECAPHHHRAGHTSDNPQDLMYAGTEGWDPQVLDPGHDDYYGHGRADCLDLARSGFLQGNPASPLPGAENDVPAPAPKPAAPACVVPRLVGLTPKRALSRLSKAGCRGGTLRSRRARTRAERRKLGKIVKQSIRAGTRRPFGAAVGVTILRR